MVGENIRRLRTEKGMTQAELAEATYVSRVTICQIELGIKNPSFQLGYEISRALGCKMEELCERKKA